jgi:hypothetical protein
MFPSWTAWPAPCKNSQTTDTISSVNRGSAQEIRSARVTASETVQLSDALIAVFHKAIEHAILAKHLAASDPKAADNHIRAALREAKNVVDAM